MTEVNMERLNEIREQIVGLTSIAKQQNKVMEQAEQEMSEIGQAAQATQRKLRQQYFELSKVLGLVSEEDVERAAQVQREEQEMEAGRTGSELI